ncbi:tetratricopeptide repeat protein [Methyloglobulus sp.]|uniref:tetratricopeptide repeat protein n=1 Tax=Methyloglobulus sp. TaxID=2518622 RepID=UPI00398966D6
MNDQNRNVQQGEKSVYAEQGDVHITYAGEREILRALTESPFRPEVFLGREDDLDAIKKSLFSENNLLLVNGNGGVGKTSIASTYYHRYQHEYAHTAWILSEKSIANAMLSKLSTPLALQFENTMPTEKRLELLLMAMDSLNKPCLLVIDNANEVEDLEKNYQNLRRCSNFHLLLTTRITEFEQAELYRIDGLPENQALALFEKHYRKTLQDDEVAIFKQIRTAVGDNTLVVELLAKNIYQFNRLKAHYSLANLLNDLQSKGLLALSKSQAVGTDYQSKGSLRKEKPEDIIAAMYDLGELSSKETAILSVLSVLPAESIGFNTLETLLPSPMFENLESNLLFLAQKGWIEYNEDNAEFKCSPVIQEITKKKNPQLLDDCQSLIETLIEKLNYEGCHITGSSYEDAALFSRYAESVAAGFNESHSNLVILCERIGVYHETTGNLDKALAFFKYNNYLVQKLYAYYPSNVELKGALQISYSNLGHVYKKLENLELALELFAESFELSKELHAAYPTDVNFKCDLAISLQRMGETHTALGNLEQALGFYGNNLELSQELYAADPPNIRFKNGLACSYQCMGETHTSLGNLELALGFFEGFNELSLDLHAAYPTEVGFKNTLAISCDKLGETHAALGNLKQALGFFENFNHLEQDLYAAYPSNVEFKGNLAISYERLGKTHFALGDLEQALGFYQDYNRLESELHADYPGNVGFKNSLAISCQFLGNTHAALGDLVQTLDFYQACNHLENELHADYPSNVGFKNQLAVSYQFLGITHAALGDLGQALGFYKDYNRLESELHADYPGNVGFKDGLAVSYAKLGGIYEQTGDKELAAQYYRLAHALLTELADNFPSYVEFKNHLTWAENKLANF